MTKPVCLTLSSLCWCLLYGFFNSAWAFTPLYYNTHAYTHALELKPIPYQSYKIAKSVFLPDFKDSEFGIIDSLSGDYSQDNCAAYTLSSCPSGANCSSCPFDAHRFKFNSCKTGYKLSGSSCIPSSCQAIGLSSSVPSGQVCTKITQSGLTCYKGCRNVSCSGYSLSCSSKPANSSSLTKCPDCNSAYSNCSNNVCKIAQCNDGYKIANNGTSCIPLDDTCPDGYFKTCDTGIESTVSPTTTEAGTKCYQCKPSTKIPDCAALQQAINNASSGQTVTMDADVTCLSTLNMKNGVTLDGDNHTLTFDDDAYMKVDSKNNSLTLSNINVRNNYVDRNAIGLFAFGSDIILHNTNIVAYGTAISGSSYSIVISGTSNISSINEKSFSGHINSLIIKENANVKSFGRSSEKLNILSMEISKGANLEVWEDISDIDFYNSTNDYKIAGTLTLASYAELQNHYGTITVENGGKIFAFSNYLRFNNLTVKKGGTIEMSSEFYGNLQLVYNGSTIFEEGSTITLIGGHIVALKDSSNFTNYGNLTLSGSKVINYKTGIDCGQADCILGGNINITASKTASGGILSGNFVSVKGNLNITVESGSNVNIFEGEELQQYENRGITVENGAQVNVNILSTGGNNEIFRGGGKYATFMQKGGTVNIIYVDGTYSNVISNYSGEVVKITGGIMSIKYKGYGNINEKSILVTSPGKLILDYTPL